MSTDDLLALVAEATDSLPGEVWASVSVVVFGPDGAAAVPLPGYAVSNLGRAVSLPRVVRQAGRRGAGVVELQRRGALLSPCLANTRIGPEHGPLVDVGRAVLTAFDGLPGPSDHAVRLDRLRWNTRLDNLAWTRDAGLSRACEFFEALVKYGSPTAAKQAIGCGANTAWAWMAEAEQATGVGRRFRAFSAAGLAHFAKRAEEVQERRRAMLRWFSGRSDW